MQNPKRLKLELPKKNSIEVYISPPAPLWTELSSDVTANILQRLGAIEILGSAQYVCTSWHNLCKERPNMWRVIDICQPRKVNTRYDLEGMCYEAVDRSQGQLIDIKLMWHGSYELLRYISRRSSQLRCLTLGYSYNTMEAITKFRNLEELHLFFFKTNISPQAIKSIGISCPNLKSFTMHDAFPSYGYIDDNIACAIAVNMHGLRHLKFMGSTITNIGVQAILDGCPYLESLDRPDRFDVVRRPNDSLAYSNHLHRFCCDYIY